MKIGKFLIYVNDELHKTYDGKEVKEFLLDWDGKLSEGKVLETSEGNMKVVGTSLLNVKEPEQRIDTEVFLIKL